MKLIAMQTEQCLQEFVFGAMSLDVLEQCLHGHAHVQFWDTNHRSVKLNSRLPTVSFTREHIDGQLQRFLAGKLSARELSDWAAALRLFGCFEVDAQDSDGSAVWDLLDEMMSPDAWSPLTTDTVIELRRRLAT